MEANTGTFQIDFDAISQDNEYSQAALYNSYPQSPATALDRSFASIKMFDSANKGYFQNDGLNDLLNPLWMDELNSPTKPSDDWRRNSVHVEEVMGVAGNRIESILEHFGSAIKHSMHNNCWNIEAIKDESASTMHEVNTLDSPHNEANIPRAIGANETSRPFPRSALKFDASPTNSQQNQQQIVLIDLADEEEEDSMDEFAQSEKEWKPTNRSRRRTVRPAKPARKIARKPREKRRH